MNYAIKDVTVTEGIAIKIKRCSRYSSEISHSELRFFGGSYSIKQFLLQESDVGKFRDSGTSVTVKMGKTRDRTVREIYVTDP